MFTRQFWRSTAERVLWTFVQAWVGGATIDGVFVGVHLDWVQITAGAGVAALACFAKCLGATFVPPAGAPSTLAPDQGGRHRRP